jgi:hypothetical protein
MKKIQLFVIVVALSLMAFLSAGSSEGSSADYRQAVFSNGMFRITSGGRYVLSGKQEGQVFIQAGKNDVVELVLDNLTLHNPNGPAIYAPRSKRVELILLDGSVNTISDGKHSNDNSNDNSAVIFVQNDLVISSSGTGNGTLNLTANFQHGIRAQDTLTIKSGVFNIKAVGDALRGRDAVIVEAGTFSLTAGGDGIQSNNDVNAERGYVTINGGTFTINAQDDGIQAESSVTINGGSLTMTVKDDGITAKGSVLITGGTIRITECYEGIEGLNVSIKGGDIDLFSRDDGINAREYVAPTNVRGRFPMGRQPMGRSPINENIYVRISGGNIHVRAMGDGIDSNNNIFFEGGTLRISGPSMGMEGAIDFDGTMLISGGTLVTAGSVTSVSPQSKQPAVIVGYSQQQPNGALIELRDSSGKTILDYTAKTSFSMSAFTSPDLVIGKTYSLYVNKQKVQDITLSSLVTAVGNSNFRGGFGGRGRW